MSPAIYHERGATDEQNKEDFPNRILRPSRRYRLFDDGGRGSRWNRKRCKPLESVMASPLLLHRSVRYRTAEQTGTDQDGTWQRKRKNRTEKSKLIFTKGTETNGKI